MKTFSSFGVIAAVLFAVVSFATSRHLFFGSVNTKYFFLTIATLFLAGIVAWRFWQGEHLLQLKNRPFLWAALALLAIYWLAAIFGIFPERSFFSDIQRSSGVFLLTHITVLAFILGEFCTVRDWVLIRRTVALSAAALSLFTVLGIEGLGLKSRFLWTTFEAPGFTLGNSTFAGVYLVLALFFVLIELWHTPARTRWWYALAGSTALVVLSPVLLNIGILWGKTPLSAFMDNPVLLLGSGRASSATAILLLVFFGGYLLVRRYADVYKKYVLAAWGAAFIITILSGVALLFTPDSFIQQKYVEASTGARILVWQGGLEAFKDRPLLGWGPENFEQAMQGHFDNRLYQDEYIGEIWFDRAHNIIVDTLVSTGVLGALVHLVLAGAFIWIIYRARSRELLGEAEATLLYALPFAHFLQLQTGFDTLPSYMLLAVIGGYVLSLERQLYPTEEKGRRERGRQYATYYKGGAIVIGALLVGSAYTVFVELNRQMALYNVFIETSPERHLALIKEATSRTSSFESLRLSSLSLIKGVLESIAQKKANQQSIENALAQLEVFEERYRAYLEVQPDYYRAHMALAYVLSAKLVFGGKNDLPEAKELVARGYELSPGNLLTPAMEALLELYSGNLPLALQKAREIVRLNPDAPFGHEVLAHIEKQRTTFPTISVLRLENL